MRHCIIVIIKLYHNLFSCNMLSVCRFYPSCSQYAIESLEKKGLWKGILLAIRRLLRCNQFSSGGFDPVQ
ncbi:MAG: membrane protein insertion efficiency factor YidD [Candidatus Omnitrophota bacterium]